MLFVIYWSLPEYFQTTVSSSVTMYAGSSPLAGVTVSVALPVFPEDVPLVFLTAYTEPLSFVTAIIYSLPSSKVLVST